ncbi:winged helix-turn-helix transcriptional regulator [Candidatus Bipolaricaulota bacterium]|nr:winged helix-turn-helix transcriptional regulator [Candidatus Bipolaricaulota bacterium]
MIQVNLCPVSENLERWAKVFAALGSAERLAVVAHLLAKRGQNCQELARSLRLSTPALSYHLRILEEAGLIVREKRGRRRCLRVSPEVKEILRPKVLAELRKEGK